MSKIYEYYWEGSFKYKGGDWIYHDKDNWSINTKSAKKFASYINRNVWNKLVSYLNKKEYDLQIKADFNDIKLLSWLTATNEKEVKVDRALSICLKHFGETVLSDQQEKDRHRNYNIVSSIVGKNITVQIKNLGDRIPCWFFLNSKDWDIVSEALADFIIALPDLFFDIKTNADLVFKVKKNLEEAAKLLKANRIAHTVTIEKDVSSNSNEPIIKFKNTGIIKHYRKGYECDCIPIPGRENDKLCPEPASVNTPEMVATSSNVVEALTYLSQVWQDKFAKSVLISAPPGSGKEAFSNSIPYGTGRTKPNEKPETLPLTSDQGSLEKMLYGFKTDKDYQPGLIYKAKDSVLFLDEVHHPEDEPGIRKSLLRPLESGDYYPSGAEINPTEEPLKVDNVLFVLATSKPLKGRKRGEKGLNNIPPLDFWTRMTHVVSIRHPFDGIWGEEFPNIVKKYFTFFWWQRLEDFFKIDPETGEDLEIAESGCKPLSHKDFKYIHRFDQMNKLKNEAILKKLADMFCKRLLFILKEERIQPYELSIRGFKNIVTRVFSISAAEIIQGTGFDEKFLEKIEEATDLVIYEILEIAKLKP